MMTVEMKPVNVEAELKSAFAVFDKDGSGTISGDEIAKVMKSFGENLTDEELKIMLQEVDKNGDGHIDCEYIRFILQLLSCKGVGGSLYYVVMS